MHAHIYKVSHLIFFPLHSNIIQQLRNYENILVEKKIE